MLKRTLVGLVAIGILGSFMGIGGFSLFTDRADNGGNDFTSGSVNISLNPTATPIWTMDSSNMAPGDEVTAPITVSNDGTLDLRYAVTSTTIEDVLAAQLQLTIKLGVTDCDNTGFPLSGTPTPLYGPGILGSTSGTKVIGNPTPGPDTGDRTLAASDHEDLCFNVKLPLDAVGPMSTNTTATFRFDAEQTKNNP